MLLAADAVAPNLGRLGRAWTAVARFCFAPAGPMSSSRADRPRRRRRWHERRLTRRAGREGGRPSMSNGVIGARGFQPRGRPLRTGGTDRERR